MLTKLLLSITMVWTGSTALADDVISPGFELHAMSVAEIFVPQGFAH